MSISENKMIVTKNLVWRPAIMCIFNLHTKNLSGNTVILTKSWNIANRFFWGRKVAFSIEAKWDQVQWKQIWRINNDKGYVMPSAACFRPQCWVYVQLADFELLFWIVPAHFNPWVRTSESEWIRCNLASNMNRCFKKMQESGSSLRCGPVLSLFIMVPTFH